MLLEKTMLFRIVLIDQRDYFEYTPGVLRLFCQPNHFANIAKKFPRRPESLSATHEFIHGRVVSIFGEPSTVSPRNSAENPPQKLVAYHPIVTNSSGATILAPSTKIIRYDYIILATGATYPLPIRPSPSEWTLVERRRGWKNVYKGLMKARRVIVLGAGAVGVELAAEIVDHYARSKDVTLVDAETSIVPLFPKAAGIYAHKWLEKRGIRFRLGQKLSSWDETCCVFADGTVLHADVVYNCLGSRPNAEILEAYTPQDISERFLFTRSRNIFVERTLQIRGGPIKDGSIFACGDVANPPSSNEKQAFQAETQGTIAARNVMELCSSSATVPKLKEYPRDVMPDGSDQMPLVADLSLGRFDGIIVFNGICIPGPLAAVLKWILEYTKVLQMQGRLLGKIIWKIADVIVLFAGSYLPKIGSVAVCSKKH